MKLNVIDAGCGVGKTTAMINFINQNENEERYLYITPFLTEVERIKNACKTKNFLEPKELPTKTDDLIRLMEKGYNIISTHALFKKITDEVLDLSKFNDYILIIDEAADVVEEIDISKNDLKTIITEYARVDENNNLEWMVPEYEGRFEDYKNMIQIGGVKAHRSMTGEIISLVWTFPIEIFESFKEVYILTYMFNGQRAYYEYNHVDINNLYVKDFQLTTEEQHYNYDEQKKLITIIDDPKLNSIGDSKGSLSMSWFYRNKNNKLVKKVQNNIYNYFYHKVGKIPMNQKLWTTFKEYKDIVKGKGYAGAFQPINIRATNDFRDATAVAYIANRYMKPTLKHFFESEGIDVDEDAYALSELLQFIYRSAIRDNKPITVYIPSQRMRTLFTEWLNKKDE